MFWRNPYYFLLLNANRSPCLTFWNKIKKSKNKMNSIFWRAVCFTFALSNNQTNTQSKYIFRLFFLLRKYPLLLLLLLLLLYIIIRSMNWADARRFPLNEWKDFDISHSIHIYDNMVEYSVTIIFPWSIIHKTLQNNIIT